MKKFHSIRFAILFCLTLTACTPTGIPPSAGTQAGSTSAPNVTITSGVTVTSSPQPTPEPATATPGEILTPMDVKNVPVDVVAGMNGVTLKDDDSMQWTFSNEFNMYGKMNEKGELQYVVYPMHFSVDEKEKVVYMPMYLSCTDGGALCVMSGMEKGAVPHGVMEVSGTDAQARALFGWIGQRPEFQNQNPELLTGLAQAAEGKKKIVWVYADLKQVPAGYQKPYIDGGIAKSYEIDGSYYNPSILTGTSELIGNWVAPFVRDGKLYLMEFRQPKYLSVPEDPEQKLFAEDILANFIVNLLGMWGKDNVPLTGLYGEEGAQARLGVTNYWVEHGPAVDKKIVK